MKLEDQVCSLEHAKRLKELGVEQISIFHWAEDMVGWKIYPNSPFFPDIGWRDSKKINNHHDDYSAFTVSELGELLPETVNTFKGNHEFRWECSFHQENYYYSKSGSAIEANARAKMLIYLIENGLINAN